MRLSKFTGTEVVAIPRRSTQTACEGICRKHVEIGSATSCKWKAKYVTWRPLM